MADPHGQTLVTILLAADDAAPGEQDTDPGLFGLDEVQIERIVLLTLARAGVTAAIELSIVVTTDDELRQLNRDFRGRDEVTDVLSFPLLDAPLVQAPAAQLWQAVDASPGNAAPVASSPSGQPSATGGDGAAASHADDASDEVFAFRAPPDGLTHLGDIVIARGATARQAAQAGHAPAWELGYLVAHGVLHLIGYDDQTDAGYAAMVAQQEAVLQQAAIGR